MEAKVKITEVGKADFVKNFNGEPYLDSEGKTLRIKTIVCETVDMFPHTLALDVLGERADTINPEVGKVYVASLNISSRLGNNGKWYHNVSAWRLRTEEQVAAEAGVDKMVEESLDRVRNKVNNTEGVSSIQTETEEVLPF